MSEGKRSFLTGELEIKSTGGILFHLLKTIHYKALQMIN